MTLKQFLARAEGEFLALLMVKHDGKARAAAKEAGIHKATLYRRLHKHQFITRRLYGNDEWRALQ